MFKLIKDTRLNEQVEDILNEGCCSKSKPSKKCEGENPESFDFDKAEDNQEKELNFDVENEIEDREKYQKVTLANEESKVEKTKKAIDLVSAMLEDEDEDEDFDGDGEDDYDPDELEALDIIASDDELADLEDDDEDDEEPLLGESTDLNSLLEKGEITAMEMDKLLEELETSLIELEGTTSEFETEDDGARMFNSETDDDIDAIIPDELDVEPSCSCPKCKKEDAEFMDELDSYLEEMELDSLLEELDIDVYDERMFLTKDEREARKSELQAAKDERKERKAKYKSERDAATDRYKERQASYKAKRKADIEKAKQRQKDSAMKNTDRYDREYDKAQAKLDKSKADYKAKKAEIKARYKAKKKEAEDALKEAAYLAEMYEMLEGTIAAFENEIDGSKIYNTDTLDDIDQIINDVLDVKPVNRPGISGHANRGDSAIH